ncbi:NYN domain-containing protein [Sphingomonas sp. CFBP8993]|uniref:NYN domain-containing protein n=1 Tax=Sphingomonas sp. CFBP8993 TaxID=3096526 RepID=UPI002A6A5997|nr:NYN domain-containing protein [Sphingomonas sp. CFBP8993]MDY0957479.1 NYN domain-containing protein [Sphingomonas sp. CFBP8993]
MNALTRNIALLIDADNAQSAAIDPVLTVLAELGTVNVRRAYGNWSKPGLKGWRDVMVKHGIEPQQQFDLTKGKNATDMKMTIDAMDLLFRGRIDGFGIMSSDSDFMPLATRIRQDGSPVYGFGNSRTPEAFKQACSRFIDVGALIGEAARPASTKPAAADVPLAESLPPSIDQGKRTAGTPRPIDEELLKLLVDAYNSVKRDERGFASLSSMGQLAGNRSSFDTRNYGFKRLADLIEAVPNFQTERREDGRTFVKRMR